MFLFKKLLAPLLYPLPVGLLLILVGVWRMYTGKERLRTRRGAGWIISGLFIIILFSFRPVPLAMISSLESQHPAYSTEVAPDTSISWVVVLSGGVTDDPALFDAHKLSSTTTLRMLEGIRVYRHLRNANLLFSGGGPFSSVSGAAMMRDRAIELGIDPTHIRIEDKSLDTKDQALAVALVVKRQPFVLVTSASHMPRSMALFTKQGTVPIPAPTDFYTRRSTQVHPGAFFPSSTNMRVARTAIREYLGLTWAWIRGQV